MNGAWITKSTSQTAIDASAVVVALTFDTESYDIGGWHDNVTNNSRLTVPSGVDYVVVDASVSIENLTDDTTPSILLLKNGSTTYDGAAAFTVVKKIRSVILSVSSGAIPVVAGDYFEVGIFCSDSSIDVSTDTYFSIRDVTASFSGAMVEKSANQTSANYSTAAAVSFNSEIYDVGGWHDNATNNSRLTVPFGVDYVVVSASFRLESLSLNTDFGFQIRKNGSTSQDCPAIYTDTQSSAAMVAGCSGPIPVVAGDYFEVFLYSTDGSVTVNAARSNFAIRAVG